MNYTNFLYLFLIIWVIGTLIMTFIIKNINEGEPDQILIKNRQYFFIGCLLGLVISLTITTFIGNFLCI